MYRTHVSESKALDAVDAALVRLRRLWTAPPHLIDDQGQPVEMSSLLVVEGCARHAAAGREGNVGTLAEFADVTHSTASRLVERAVAVGLVVRAPSPEDGRRTALTLTPAGWALRERAVAFRRRWLSQTLADWPDHDVAALGDLLTRFADAVAVSGGPGSSRR